MLMEGETEVSKWKSITATNYRIVQKKGIIWKSFRDINYDHLSSVFTGRKPIRKLIEIGIAILVISFLMTYSYFYQLRLVIYLLIVQIFGSSVLIIGIFGMTKTIFYGTNSKIEEGGESLDFMKIVNSLRLKYKKPL